MVLYNHSHFFEIRYNNLYVFLIFSVNHTLLQSVINSSLRTSYKSHICCIKFYIFYDQSIKFTKPSCKKIDSYQQYKVIYSYVNHIYTHKLVPRCPAVSECTGRRREITQASEKNTLNQNSFCS